jgi:hypothetical protein
MRMLDEESRYDPVGGNHLKHIQVLDHGGNHYLPGAGGLVLYARGMRVGLVA